LPVSKGAQTPVAQSFPIKLIGVGPHEWQVSQLRSLHSADDGVDLTNSHIRLNRLEVRQPTEDGLNLSSSRIEIRRSL
jgi:hypothetical protein